ncbi:ribonuclease-like 3, partial [Clarias magur]
FVMEMCQSGLVLLLVLYALPPAKAPPSNVKRLYEKFLNNHVYENMTKDDCTGVMFRRGISSANSNKCKLRNTFILASAEQ